MTTFRLSPAACAIAFAVLVAGCSTTSDRIIDLNQNTKGYRISCDGPFSSRSECYHRAADTCTSKGYSVVNEGPLTGQDWMSDKYEVTAKCNN